jgi:hypothetical protein
LATVGTKRRECAKKPFRRGAIFDSMRGLEPLDRLLASLCHCCQSLPDRRSGTNTQYAMADFGLAAFSVFFMQSPSFLEHQRHLATGQGRSNCETLFGMTKIPGDSQIRAKLDPIEPSRFDPMFDAVIAELQRSGGIDQFRRLDGHVLIALDGTQYHSSNKVRCPQCSTRQHGNGKTEYHHAMLAATLVAPGHNRVVPLIPEFIVPQDGHDKQDCESRAVRRWLAAHGARYAPLDPVFLGDDLFSRQPICAAVLAAGGHFLFVCKPASHPTIEAYRTGVRLDTRKQRIKRGRDWFTYRYQWMCAVPLRGDSDAMTVNWLMIEIVNAAGKVTYRNSFVTDLPVDRATVVELAACGRARWKIENETFNTLKNQGYNLEHNFGHGGQNLAAVLTTLNLLAFACHTVCDLAIPLWRAAVEKIGTRKRFFEHLRSITVFLVFPSWRDILQTLAFVKPAPRPP